MQYRKTAGDSTMEEQSSINNANVIQLERKGNDYTMSVARFGETFTSEQLTGISLGDSVYVGLFVCSHDAGKTTKAAFSNVRIVKPAPDTLVQYRDYLGSNLEIMDVESGERKILHESPKSLQAPNWTPDGNTLIYNSEGLLYNFDLDTKTPEVLNTDFADANNNDHVLSFDGSQIGISHHADEHDGNSIIYTLPIEGGTPKKVTSKGPSYLHGWSPDGNWLTYTGGRDGEYDIYKIPVEGGEEIKLTDFKGLDDGSEYSPDGKFIYFNSVRSGSMEIWRMRPDGSNPEQLTNDNFNNWFPHISPDGRKMIFLSYLPDVDPSDHPFYKQVYLRIMPVDGGEPKVVAYVYGGQGTINVPSWSPDGTKVSFISNTGM
jgi:Tol biopolymer transport system component